MIKLSIIIPVYNCYKLAKDLIADISCQLTSEVELIVVDDGSTDEIKNDDRHFIYHLKKNRGVSFARNYGVATSTGQYITFVDADDKVTDNFVEQILKAIKEDNGVSGAYWFKTRTDTGYEMHHYSPMWGKVIGREYLEAFPFNTKKKAGEDIEWNDQVWDSEDITIRRIDQTIYNYRWAANPDSLSKRYNRGEFE